MTRNEKFDLFLLLVLSLLLSLYLSFQTYVISLDGALQYIPLAKEFASGFYRKALSHNQQPLYSLIVALVSRWVPDFELAGKLVSSIFGILLVVPVYFLGKRIFDEKIAILSSLFLALHAYIRRFSADVLKESTYLFFLTIALWLAFQVIQGKKKYAFLFIPLFSVIAYLVRPDGIEVLLIVFLYVLFIKKFSTSGEKSKVILFLLLSSVVLLLPYLFYLKEIRGGWTFGKAKSIVEMSGIGVIKDEIPFAQKILYSLKSLNLDILAMFHPVYIFLLLIGLLKGVFSRFKTGEGFLLTFCAIHYLVLFLMVLNTTVWGADKTVQVDYSSGRHVLPLLLISIFWVGEGFMAIHQWISKRIEVWSVMLRIGSKRGPAIIFTVLLTLFLTTVLPKTLKPQRYDRLPEKWAGMWIKNESGKGMDIFTSLPRVAYYAEGNCEYIDLKKEMMDSVKASMAKKGAIYLVLREREVLGRSDTVQPIRNDFDEVMRYEEKGMVKIIIYKLAKCQ